MKDWIMLFETTIFWLLINKNDCRGAYMGRDNLNTWMTFAHVAGTLRFVKSRNEVVCFLSHVWLNFGS